MDVIIILNGKIKNDKLLQEIINKASYIICADGAARHLVPLKIVPDLLVGDLDSINAEDLVWMKKMGVKLKKFPAKKDYTDSELAVEYALELKPKRVTIIGGVGSRWDHSIGNIMLLLKLLNHGIIGRLIDERNELTITKDEATIEGEKGNFLSIIPITKEVKGVTLEGLEYPLTNHHFHMGSTLGISNQFLGNKAIVRVDEGVLLVCKSRD